MSLTPMMKQYQEIKDEYPDCLLFYRLGDFYELFYDDAEVASKELGIVLTKRTGSVPMCGVPWHAYEMYLSKLIRNGHKVAICEQLETAEESKERGGQKSTIKRGVTRVVTRGTLIESSMINEKKSNFLMSIAYDKNGYGIAYADISTYVFKVENIKQEDILTVVTKVNPSEIVCHDTLLKCPEILNLLNQYKSIMRTIPSSKFTNNFYNKDLTDFYGIKFIDAIGSLPESCIEAVALIIRYISNAYIDASIKLPFPQIVDSTKFMHIDHFTRKSLELYRSTNGDKKGSLLHTIDRTLTSPGARMLSEWISNPLFCKESIAKRLDIVEFFVHNIHVLTEVREVLKDFPDVERAISRVTINKCGPRDLVLIKNALQKIVALSEITSKFERLQNLGLLFEGLNDLIRTLDEALLEVNIPCLTRDGGFIKPGFDGDLDEIRKLVENTSFIVDGMQKKYIKETGIQNIKIKNNGILGYFIETSPNNASKVPYGFSHRQTLASCIRYTTDELSSLSVKIQNVQSDTIRRELFIFENLCTEVSRVARLIKNATKKISFLDCVTSLAALALQNKYVRPVITDEKVVQIKDGRHPAVESYLLKDGDIFTSNDCHITDDSIISIVTGPNMGGKSTYLRQNAIIIIMAHIGSFVPAGSAVIGLTDKIYSRVGASDDISSGKSTFMVEMLETAVILRHATDRSFIILDEIGRGTSTYDGLAIAWAVIQEIHDNIKARTLFATHYHEMKKIQSSAENVKFLTVKVKEDGKKIVFMHKITDGFADKSYGLHVAEIAGFPEHVVSNASDILKTLS